MAEIAVELHLFARLREACEGRSRLSLTLPEGATPEACFESLCERYAGVRSQRRGLAVAVNDEYVSWNRPLVAGDAVSFIPPVSGG